MSESAMRKALADFERALAPLVPDAEARHAFTAAVYTLINATLNHVVVIVNQRATAGTLAPYPPRARMIAPVPTLAPLLVAEHLIVLVKVFPPSVAPAIGGIFRPFCASGRGNTEK